MLILLPRRNGFKKVIKEVLFGFRKSFKFFTSKITFLIKDDIFGPVFSLLRQQCQPQISGKTRDLINQCITRNTHIPLFLLLSIEFIQLFLITQSFHINDISPLTPINRPPSFNYIQTLSNFLTIPFTDSANKTEDFKQPG